MKKGSFGLAVCALFILLPTLMYGIELKPYQAPLQRFRPAKDVMVHVRASLDINDGYDKVNKIEVVLYKDGEYNSAIISDSQDDVELLQMPDFGWSLAVIHPTNSFHTFRIYPYGSAYPGMIPLSYDFDWKYSIDRTGFTTPTQNVYANRPFEENGIVIDANSPNEIFINISGRMSHRGMELTQPPKDMKLPSR